MRNNILIQVERLPGPIRVAEDFHELFWTTAYGYLHIGDSKLILTSPEQVTALEILCETVRAAEAYRSLLPSREHMTLPPGSRSRRLAVAVDRLRDTVSLTPDNT